MADKNILLIFRNPPFADSSNRDSLDIALACSAFDIPVSLLFLNDAVLQLISNQRSELLEQKNLLKTFKALAMYDIKNFYVLDSDLQRYQLDTTQLAICCEALKPAEVAVLIRKSTTVINL
ncbi:MAG: hypothetical protein OFPII_16900 [Osedax symbiont Rs1]|nr:MAG: hypothetical protein OFPII_16900 [Osedax symbiont Rs1]